jgi:inner membrane protein
VELPTLSLTIGGLLLIGIVGGQFPDIDEPHSTIANSGRAVGRMLHQHGVMGFVVKVLFWIVNFIPQTIAWVANNFFGGHRGVVHSLLAMLVVSGLVGTATYYLLGTAFYGAMFGVAYLTHLVGDMLTRSGIKLLLPFSDHSFHLLPPGVRFKADSEWQNGLVQALAGVAIAASAWVMITILA